VKTIPLRLTNVEAAMLLEVQRKNKHLKAIGGWAGSGLLEEI